MATKAIEAIVTPYEEGFPAILVTGRSLYDFDLHTDGKVRPLIEILRQVLRARYGMLLVTYSLATGLDYDASRINDQRDRTTIETTLQSHQLLNIPQDQNEVVRVIRGIYSLSRTPTNGLKWADGRDLRFAFLFEFTEHLTPGCLTNGTQTDTQLVAIELSHITAQSLALRSSGNLMIFHGREGQVDELVSSALYHIRLPQPDLKDKKDFLAATTSLYTAAKFATGMSVESVAYLTTNTPNRGLESLLRAAHRSGRELTVKELVAQKSRDVETLSEHTLTVLDTERVNDLQLRGFNIAKPRLILERYAAALVAGDRSMPANVLLTGPPGTGKTDLAILTARQAAVAAYQMHSPKGSLVGETERKVRLQQMVLQESIPNIAFIDEVTEALPLERSEFDGDSGASRAVTAALLTALSDESRRGQSLLIATTNCPWRMGAAMRSRFTIIPVLHPLKADFPGIILATASRITTPRELSENDPQIIKAAEIFYQKGANPRQIRSALSNALMLHGSLTSDTVLFAAMDLNVSSDLVSAIYADLWAIKACSSQSFFPWTPPHYPFPPHLEDIVDPITLKINQVELDRRIDELRPHANL
ncbi:AAA ATPase central domain protein [Crinalium epipsammum PCC 9333]|uniref:AAA ATPase central domain protein n=1 Tax=Crinalium epipsammum PCC 9333 TaxID=1173022 RepID=K9VVG7_9CYAN|nr:ATP-binding protein [Crinalium epipsammum]AFZ11534.1 AAA ATPase central domain protein [Crinalium epipsammum PCC 9333]